MHILGVVDLKAGRAVHAVAGVRERYQPVAAVAGVPIAGDPVALAHAYRAQEVAGVYVADLDAIAGGPPQDDRVLDLVRTGMPVWLDAGIANEVTALHAVNTLGVDQVVVGLETLPCLEALDVICISIGGERVAFSLDLRDGVPVDGSDLVVTAARAARSGTRTIIVLDLAHVGMATGVDRAIVRAVRAAAPGPRLIAGGGIRDQRDVDRLRDDGCDGVLAATALHRGVPLS